MTYHFYESDVFSSDLRISQAIAQAPSPEFSAFESMAVWLGMHDGPETLRSGLVARWLEKLCGILPRRPLTDPHLESIRRVTVALRLGLARRIAGELEAAREAGVSEPQIEAIRDRVRSGRPSL